MNIKELLRQLKEAFEEKDSNRLKEISNKAIEEAAVKSDKDLARVSLISYSLYKLFSKPHFRKSDKWEGFLQDIESDLKDTIQLEKDKMDLKKILEEDILEDIYEIDESYGNYVRNLLDHIRVKQASRAYAMGLSFDKAASLTGADIFKLYEYIGSTNIHDIEHTSSKDLIKRYEETKELLE